MKLSIDKSMNFLQKLLQPSEIIRDDAAYCLEQAKLFKLDRVPQLTINS